MVEEKELLENLLKHIGKPEVKWDRSLLGGFYFTRLGDEFYVHIGLSLFEPGIPSITIFDRESNRRVADFEMDSRITELYDRLNERYRPYAQKMQDQSLQRLKEILTSNA